MRTPENPSAGSHSRRRRISVKRWRLWNVAYGHLASDCIACDQMPSRDDLTYERPDDPVDQIEPAECRNGRGGGPEQCKQPFRQRVGAPWCHGIIVTCRISRSRRPGRSISRVTDRRKFRRAEREPAMCYGACRRAGGKRRCGDLARDGWKMPGCGLQLAAISAERRGDRAADAVASEHAERQQRKRGQHLDQGVIG